MSFYFHVSILVLVDVLPEQGGRRQMDGACGVSILVLVDVLPEHFRNERLLHLEDCFNPCFSGCPSRTLATKGYVDLSVSFNPCFSGCPSRTTNPGGGISVWEMGFNPCFSGCPSRTLLQ